MMLDRHDPKGLIVPAWLDQRLAVICEHSPNQIIVHLSGRLSVRSALPTPDANPFLS